MDPRSFVNPAMGRLVDIGEDEVAFVPAPLDRDYEPSSAIWKALADVNVWLGRTRGIGDTRAIPNPGVLIRPLQYRESLRSSSLEGTFVEPDQLLIYDPGQGPAAHQHEADPWREAYNLARALEIGETLVEKRGFDLELVLELHRVLTTGVRGGRMQPGQWRRNQVVIGTTRRYVPPPAENLATCLQDFERAMAGAPKQIPGLLWTMMVHYQFEAIHPFRDGNGRVGRALLSLMLGSRTDLGRPWAYLSPFFERHKDEYIDLLLRVSTHGDWDRWLAFCLHATRSACEDAVQRMTALIDLWQTWMLILREHDIKARVIPLLSQLLARPYTTITRASELSGVAYNTAKADLKRLEDAGIVHELIDVHPTTYRAHQVFHIVFGGE